MHKLRKALGTRWVPYTVATCSAVVVHLILAHLVGIWNAILGIFSFLAPVIWGAIIAYIIDALVVLYERTLFKRARRRRTARRVAILLALITVLLFLVLFFLALIPQLIDSISGLISNLGGYVTSLRSLLDNATLEIAGFTVDLSGIANYGEDLLKNLTTTLQDNIGRIINTSFTIGKGFMNVIISCILAIYFLLDKERLQRVARALLRARLPQERYRQTVSFLRRCNHILIRFITCDLLDGLVVGIVNFLFMKIANMPYAVLISVVVGVANLVPTFGPIAGGAIGAFILLLVEPRSVLLFLIFTVILQTIDGYIFKPKLYGDSLGVSSLWVLVCIIVFGRMFGTAGMVLAIPFAAISDFLFRDVFWRRLHRRIDADDAAAEPPAAEPEEKISEEQEIPY